MASEEDPVGPTLEDHISVTASSQLTPVLTPTSSSAPSFPPQSAHLAFNHTPASSAPSDDGASMVGNGENGGSGGLDQEDLVSALDPLQAQVSWIPQTGTTSPPASDNGLTLEGAGFEDSMMAEAYEDAEDATGAWADTEPNQQSDVDGIDFATAGQHWTFQNGSEDDNEYESASNNSDIVEDMTPYSVTSVSFPNAQTEYALHGVTMQGDSPWTSTAFISFIQETGQMMGFGDSYTQLTISEDSINDNVEFNEDGAVQPSEQDADDADFLRFISKLKTHYYGKKEYECLNIAPNCTEKIRSWKRPPEVTREMMEETGCDSQAIPWGKAGLGIERREARKIRKKEYKNFRHHYPIERRLPESEKPVTIPNDRHFFDFHSVDQTQQCRPIHFQLRNLLAATSRTDVYFAADSVVTHTNPCTGRSREIMDLSSLCFLASYPSYYRITTMTAAHDVCVVGDYNGLYAMKSLSASYDAPMLQGLITNDDNGITNHVHVHTARYSGRPLAVFCSNDRYIRRLDCETGTFLEEHRYQWAINCSTTSPDTRLRVIVGDMTDVLITDADRGTVLRTLPGHQDFGFAAAWSEDGIHVATGNQDKTVRIYDARNWSRPIKVLAAEMAGVRALRFSPLGTGPKVLAMTEPADIVHMVDGSDGLFAHEQMWDCFGEMGGVDFTPDGEELFVANTDKWFGGIIRFRRAGDGRAGLGYERRALARGIMI